MRQLFLAYRVLATVVGCSIITLIVIGVPLEFGYKWWPNLWPNHLAGPPAGTGEHCGANLQCVGTDINLYLGTAHGFIYMAFFLVALMIGVTSRWPIGFLIVTLLCGTIPFVSFWAEGRAIKRIRAEHPELGPSPTG